MELDALGVHARVSIRGRVDRAGGGLAGETASQFTARQVVGSRRAQHEVRGSTPMALVEFSPHLPRLFPQLAGGPIQVQASTVAGVLQRLEALAPGVAFYICDERGRLRKHVNIFVAGEMIMDRQALTDELEPTTRVFVAQALSGG